jgi:hypothetical protein
MEVSEARRLRELEDENRKLKHIVADQALDIRALKLSYFIAQVDSLRKKVGAEPKREDSPWDSPALMSKPRQPLVPQP